MKNQVHVVNKGEYKVIDYKTNVDSSDIKSVPAEVIATADIGNDNVIFMKCEKTHKVLLARDAKTSYENITLLLENLGLDLRVAKFPKTSVEITFKQNRPFSADSNLFLTTLKQFDTHGNVNLSPHFDYLEKHAQGYQI